MPSLARLGTAGWAIPRPVADRFAACGSGLERYAGRFNAVEINSTFYRPHRAGTFARWAAATPDGFRFAVKAPRAVTHEARLVQCEAAMAAFLAQVGALGPKLDVVLIQLPPSLGMERSVAEAFFSALRATEPGLLLACEPRHVSWFEDEADAILTAYRVARVAADPARHPNAGEPGGWRGCHYYRLHGSPRMYYSAYDAAALADLARRLSEAPAGSWCVFDNTTSGAAAANVLTLQDMLAAPPAVQLAGSGER